MSSEPEKVETTIVIRVPSGYREGARLDQYLTSSLQNASRSKVQQGIRAGQVEVNGRQVSKSSYVVQAGDEIVCTVMKPPPIAITPEEIPLDILFEDDALIVVNKAAGMVVHPAYGNRTGTLVNALLFHIGAASIDLEEDDPFDDVNLSTLNAEPSFPGDPTVRPGIVHRLDKGTSGLLVVAKTDRDHAHLARQFYDHTVERMYQAILWGIPAEDSGTIDQPIARSPRDRKKMAVQPAGKQAVTHFSVVEKLLHTSVCHFKLETGRTHQIRVHSAFMGHPLVGDTTYGGDRIRSGPDTRSRNQFFANLFSEMPHQALHAAVLGFVHPRSGETVRFEARMPEDMGFVLSRLKEIEP
ncbi:MAG: RluA family pseudouridine synthase [Rhodothermales bacterium]|nr:RluA family pseudouridine synthase [Rhodothermales bacterium]